MYPKAVMFTFDRHKRQGQPDSAGIELSETGLSQGFDWRRCASYEVHESSPNLVSCIATAGRQAERPGGDFDGWSPPGGEAGVLFGHLWSSVERGRRLLLCSP